VKTQENSDISIKAIPVLLSLIWYLRVHPKTKFIISFSCFLNLTQIVLIKYVEEFVNICIVVLFVLV
jgi:hypothetical protein